MLVKMDFDVAFRNIPIHLNDLPLLGFTLDDLYFINSTMAFGARSSCKIFEEFATSIQWILDNETNSTNSSHYLDDFIMVHTSSAVCAYYMSKLQDICDFIGAPLSPDKMVGPMQIIKFLGLTLNFLKQVVQIPLEKVQKAITQIDYLLSTQYVNNKNFKRQSAGKKHSKTDWPTQLHMQGGPLREAFSWQAIQSSGQSIFTPHQCTSTKTQTSSQGMPGQRFLARSTHVEAISLRSHLSNPQRSQVPPLLAGNQGPQIFADATGSALLCFGCVYPEKGFWAHVCWPLSFFKHQTPSIALLELFSIVIVVEMWVPPLLQGKQIHLCSDNEATVFCLNKKSSKNNECMFLICHLALTCMQFQIYVTAQHYLGKKNVLADALSWGKIHQFHQQARQQHMMEEHPTQLPSSLWPLSWKIPRQ